MGRYSHPCRYCQQVIPPDSTSCPLCGKSNPHQARCPQCLAPTRSIWKSCNSCGLKLETTCPECLKITFLDDYCQHCGRHLVIHCPSPKCRFAQPPVGDKCRKCGKPLNLKEE